MDCVTLLNILCLLTAGMLAGAGVFFMHYRDTLLERVGLSAIALWCFVRVAYEVKGGLKAEGTDTFLYAGLALFAVGFALELCKRDSVIKRT